MLAKPRRQINRENRALIKSLPCFVCEATPTDPDHFRSRGAGGSDDLSNLNALCRRCHIARHSLGIRTFWDRFCHLITAARDKYDLPPLDMRNLLD